MNFQEFMDEVRIDLLNYFQDRNPGLELKQMEVKKLQGESYTALMVSNEGQDVKLSLNMNRYYDMMQNDVMYDEILDLAAEEISKNLELPPEVDVAGLTSFEQSKDKLVIEVVNTERNADMLEKIPHTNVEDLSLVYRVEIGKVGTGIATCLVTNEQLQLWGVSLETLHQQALANSAAVRPPKIKSLNEIMEEMTGVNPESVGMGSPMYVVTNEQTAQGAAVLFYPEAMKQCADAGGGDYFVLPSSVHEQLLLPDTGTMTAAELATMVKSVNQDVLEAKEFLSDHAYHYDAKEQIFERADQYEARMQAKEKSAGRPSVLEGLKASKEQVAARPAPEKTGKHKAEQSL